MGSGKNLLLVLVLPDGDNRWYLDRCGSCLIRGFTARWVFGLYVVFPEP